MKNFIWNTKEFGFKIALDNLVLGFAKWFVGGKRIQVSYRKRGEK